MALLTACSCEEEPAPPPPPPVNPPPLEPEPEPEPAPDVEVVSAEGQVEVERDGTWQAVTTGDRVAEEEHVRTGEGAEARLRIGAEDEVILRSKSEVSIRDVTATVAKVRLERGRVGADLKGKVVLQVESAGSSAVAEAKSGKFSVFNSGAGLVSVASETAEVTLKGEGGDAVVAAGQKAVVEKDGAPQLAEIPDDVYLNVAWPTAKVTRKKSLPIEGRAEADSEVLVNGRSVAVGSDGTFRVELPLKEGQNPIEVTTTDVLGRTSEAKRSFVARWKAPDLDADSEGMWE